MRLLLLITLFGVGSLSSAPASGQIRICILNSCGEERPTEEDAARRAERQAEADKKAAEAKALADQREADFAKRRQALLDANNLSAHRRAEAERLARLQYEAAIARARAKGCWVPGDPPKPKGAPSCATQQ